MDDVIFTILMILYPFALAIINAEKIERLKKRIAKLEEDSPPLPTTQGD